MKEIKETVESCFAYSRISRKPVERACLAVSRDPVYRLWPSPAFIFGMSGRTGGIVSSSNDGLSGSVNSSQCGDNGD